MNRTEKLLEEIRKSDLVKKTPKETMRFLRKNLDKIENIDLDKNYWLHKAGLSTYNPTRARLGGVGLFVLGAALGGFAALLLAPKNGEELRRDLKDRTRAATGKDEEEHASSTPAYLHEPNRRTTPQA